MKIFSLFPVISLISVSMTRGQTNGSCTDTSGPSKGQICFDVSSASATVVQYDDSKMFIKVICYCPDEYHKNGTCSWYKDGQSVSEDSSNKVFQTSYYPPSLSVSNQAPSSEDGEYRCAIKDDIGIYEIFDVDIHVKNNETLLNPSDSVMNVNEGDAVNITCVGNGIPSPEYTWISPEGDESNSADGILQLPFILKTDEGKYTCISENIVGDPPLPPCQSSKNVTIKVGTLADSFLTFLPDVRSITMIIGGEVQYTSVSCICETNPCLWYRNQTLVTNDESTEIYQFEGNSVVELFVTNRANSSHTGEYACSLTAELRIHKLLTVNVKEKDNQLEKTLSICLLVIICIILILAIVAAIYLMKRNYQQSKVGSETSSVEMKSEDVFPTQSAAKPQFSFHGREEWAVPKNVYEMSYPIPRASTKSFSELSRAASRNT